jgi:hypothetical protein
MPEKLNLVWENSPDTPINATSLSKYVEYYSEGLMLFVDSPNFINNGDSLLKLRANSKIPIILPTTNAYFGFNNSVISHDSRYTPTAWSNTTFRIETKNSFGTSIAIEDSTTNLFLNPSFEANSTQLTNWTTTATSPSTVSIDTTTFLDGAQSAKISIDPTGKPAGISQTIANLNTTTTQYSVSFYYMGTLPVGVNSGTLNVQITAAVSGSTWYLWPGANGWQWQLVVNTFSILLNSTNAGKWTRYEIANMDLAALTALGALSLELSISSTSPSVSFNIDSVQLEQKTFCSSFVASNRSAASQLRYGTDIIRLDEGTVDFNFMLKNAPVSGSINFFTLRTVSSQSALWLYYDFGAQQFTLSILDSSNTQHLLNASFVLSNYLNQWIRLIVIWKKDVGMSLYVNNTLISSMNDNFTPTSISNLRSLDGFEIGESDGAGLVNGLFDDFKINLHEKSILDIGNDFISGIVAPDENTYTLFENVNNNIVLDASYLDIGNTFNPNTFYYVWVMNDIDATNDSFETTASLIISSSNLVPATLPGVTPYTRQFGRIMGGFTTDSNALPIYTSVWDLSTQFTKTAMFERLLIHGTQTTGYSGSPLTNIEFRSTPYGAANDATFNVDSRFTKHVYGNQSGTDFFDLDTANGVMNIDNVQINSNYVTTISNELLVTAASGQNVEITATTVNIHENGGQIWLDNVRVVGNNIYAAVTAPIAGLVINNDKTNSTSNITIDSRLGNTIINGANTTINPTTNTYIQGVQTQITSSNGVLIQPTPTTSSGNITISTPTGGKVIVDNVTIKTNTVSTAVGNLVLTAHAGSVVEVSTNTSFDPSVSVSFGSQTRQMINTYGTTFGIGVQSSTQYFRTGTNFAFFEGGVHNDTAWNAGGGTLMAALVDISSGTSAIPSSSISPNSAFISGRVYNAVYNDLAECWERDHEYEGVEYGTVMVQTNHGIRPSARRAEKGTVGVVSNTYGFILGAEGYNDKDLNSSAKLPIAISGRVSVRLFGDAKIGDLLVSYRSGFAVKATWFEKVFKNDRILGQVDSQAKNGLCLMKVR